MTRREHLAEVFELADVELGIHGLHLRADGRGQAVGRGGTLLDGVDDFDAQHLEFVMGDSLGGLVSPAA